MATISRLLKNIGLFCKRALWKRRYSAKETYNFKGSTNRSHPIGVYMPHTYTQTHTHTHRHGHGSDKADVRRPRRHRCQVQLDGDSYSSWLIQFVTHIICDSYRSWLIFWGTHVRLLQIVSELTDVNSQTMWVTNWMSHELYESLSNCTWLLQIVSELTHVDVALITSYEIV